MAFQGSKLKNMVMPARHISSQSFDEILSDLGDDPAIPDPHGIRKPPPHQGATPNASGRSNRPTLTDSLNKLQIPTSIQKIGGMIALFFGVSIAAIFIAFKSSNQDFQSTQADSQMLISELKKELALMRDEFHQDQDDLYAAIEEIEVSIHSINIQQPTQSSQSKPAVIPYEADLRRWRYLGITRMGVAEQAFFHTGNSTKMVLKGDKALGEWRLSQAEKELAVLTHPKGKSITFKSTQLE